LYNSDYVNETNIYNNTALRIITDITKKTNDSISMEIDTSKVMNERPWLQAKTRGKILSEV
jgi:hypothetical protein